MNLALTLTFALVIALGSTPAQADDGSPEVPVASECGGAVVAGCYHSHGANNSYCPVYTEGVTHIQGGTPILNFDSWCLHYTVPIGP